MDFDVDVEAGKQLRNNGKYRQRNAKVRLAAVDEALKAKDITPVYTRLKVSGSTFYYWRVEWVLTRYIRKLLGEMARLRDDLATAQKRIAALEGELGDTAMSLKGAKALLRQPVSDLALAKMQEDLERSADPRAKLTRIEVRMRALYGDIRTLAQEMPHAAAG